MGKKCFITVFCRNHKYKVDIEDFKAVFKQIKKKIPPLPTC